MTLRTASGISAEAVPRPLGANAGAAQGLSPADWFVLSRVDGSTPVRVLRQLVGLAEAEFDAALTRLVQAGVLSVPGFTPTAPGRSSAPAPASPAGASNASGGGARSRSSVSPEHAREELGRPSRAAAAPPARPAAPAHRAPAAPALEDVTTLCAAAVPPGWPTPFDRFQVDEARLQDGTALTREQKLVLLYVDAHLRKVTYYQLLGVQQSAGNAAIRAAYFRLSKVFHPDRWFRKDIGEFERVMVGVFKWLNRAYLVLSSPKKRKGYDRLLQQGYLGEWQIEESDQPRRNAPPAPPAHPAAEPPPRGASESAVPSPAETARASDASRSVATLLMRARKSSTDGDWRGAADAYLRAVQLQGTTELRILAVECMLKANAEPSEIEREVRAAAAQSAGDTRVLILEAEVARRLGQPDRAARCYKDVLAIEPSNPVARLGLERLGIEPD